MGCGSSSANQGQAYHWHSKWGGDDEPGEYIFGRVPSCVESAISSRPISPYAKPRGSFLGGLKEAAAEAKESMDEKARELAMIRSRPSAKEFLLAAETGDAQLVGQMLKDGALIDAVGSGMKTPLIVACENGHELAAQVLIRQGADIYATCAESGATPLLLACAQGHDAIVIELCANRVDLWPVRARVSSPACGQASDGQYTPFSVLCENGRTGLLERLLNRGLITNPPDPTRSPWSRMAWSQAIGEGVALAASMGEVGVVRLCLDNQLPPDSRDRKGWTALGRAVQCGHLPTVHLLLERGATIDYRQPNGGNVFHVAAEMGRDDAGQLTLEYAARKDLATLMALITMKDKRGRKPVDVAVESKQRGFLEMLAAFISPPPPREQHHFDAILRLAVFFEDLSGGTSTPTAAEDGQRQHLKPITIRTMAGAAAQQCLDDLRPNDKVVRIVRRAGYDSDARPLGCPHGMFKSCSIASDDEETRNEGCLKLAKALREVVTAEQELQAKNKAHMTGIVGKAIVKKSSTATEKEDLERTEMLYKAAGLSVALGGGPIFSTTRTNNA